MNLLFFIYLFQSYPIPNKLNLSISLYYIINMILKQKIFLMKKRKKNSSSLDKFEYYSDGIQTIKIHKYFPYQ